MAAIENLIRRLGPAMPVFGGLTPMSKLLALFGPLMLMAAIVCVQPSDENVVDGKVLEGILQNVDSVNSEITIETKDGETVTLKLGADAPVEADGTSSDLGSLVAGASIEVEVKDDGRVVQRIKSRQAKAEGVVVGMEGDEITVESEGGRLLTVHVLRPHRHPARGRLGGYTGRSLARSAGGDQVRSRERGCPQHILRATRACEG